MTVPFNMAASFNPAAADSFVLHKSRHSHLPHPSKAKLASQALVSSNQSYNGNHNMNPHHTTPNRRFSMKSTPTSSVLRLALLAACAAPLPALAFAALGDLPGGSTDSFSIGVSGDGSVAVGRSAGASGIEAFRWTQAGGMVGLGDLAGGSFYSEALGVNSDGSVVVGDSVSGSGTEAFRWTQAGGMVGLGDLAGGGFGSVAFAVNSDGSVAVGYGTSASGVEAFRWTQAGGMVGLGDLAGGAFQSLARGVSGDGLVVVGQGTNAANAGEAFRWTQAGGIVGLGDLAGGGFNSYATGANSDGSVVVGQGTSASGEEAMRWTQAGGMVGLGDLAGGGFQSGAMGVNGDGSVVVGFGNSAAGQEAFRWTQAGGMQSVADWLTAAGVPIAAGYRMVNAAAVSADGSVVVGEADPAGPVAREAYIARVSGSGGGSGSISLAGLQQSLVETTRAGNMALTSSNLVLHGAHSRPLARRVDAGQKAFWAAGDLGADNHGERDGNLGVAEIGAGYNLGGAQMNLSLGQTWANQELSHSGKARADGTYLMAETFVPLGNALWATLGGYYQWGEADIRRGYLNAGLPTTSNGETDSRTWALRARLDWENSLALGNTQLTPYADLSHIEARTDAYTETGGGFPVQFNARTDRATDLRLGMNSVLPVAEQVRVVGTLELAHRFQDTQASTSGQVIGLFGFNLTGADNKQTWLRAGVGVEGKLGKGTGSLMLNATTEGAAPTAWLATSYQMEF
ncbi:MAG: autotransporter domain-containing protein [Methylotenera sp.]|nr:autotransporter domain-containing protein [Methylotenera sp.]